MTFGFGAGLFTKDGNDRYGLAAHRPDALVDLPRFNGDQLVEAHTGGDLSVQACADDPQVAFHAVRQLARARRLRGPGPLGADRLHRPARPERDAAQSHGLQGRHQQSVGHRPQRDGQIRLGRRRRARLDARRQLSWSSAGSAWPSNIGTALTLAFQEQTVGRQKLSGAPLGGKHEFDPPDLAATDKDGNPVIPENAHVRLAVAETNDGAQILRRPYSYNDGVELHCRALAAVAAGHGV